MECPTIIAQIMKNLHMMSRSLVMALSKSTGFETHPVSHHQIPRTALTPVTPRAKMNFNNPAMQFD
jgi:hypothetical protein